MIDFEAIARKHDEIRRREKAVETLQERATDISVKLTGMPSGGGDGKQQENSIVALVDAKKNLETARAELQEMLRPLRAACKKLEKWQHKDVIRLRFIKGMTIDQTCEAIGYEQAQVCRLQREAKDIINGYSEKMIGHDRVIL